MEMVSSVPAAQQAMMILMMSLFSQEALCAALYLRMCLRTPEIIKISWGACPQTPLE